MSWKGTKKSIPETFLEQLNDPLICVLLVAAFVSFLLKEYSDTVIIGVVILLNATVGVIQEGKAQKALDSLKKLTSPEGARPPGWRNPQDSRRGTGKR